MSEKSYEYKSVKFTVTSGCLVLENLIDLGLNEESKNGWELMAIFPHSCPSSNSCIVAIFKKELRV